jgi:hypothetical protein
MMGVMDMLHAMKRAVLAVALVATTFGAATTAQARDRDYRRGGGGDDAAIAIGAGVVGLAIGAALASDNHGRRYYRDRYYPRSRYRNNYYYDSYPGYYQDNYPRYYRGYPRYKSKRHYRNRYHGSGYYSDRYSRNSGYDGYSRHEYRHRNRGW